MMKLMKVEDILYSLRGKSILKRVLLDLDGREIH